jgi:hypothetical protein
MMLTQPLFYNLTVEIHEMYKNGIEPIFIRL